MALHRFGENAFKSANQIALYNEILNRIIEIRDVDNTFDSQLIYNELTNDGLFNFNPNNAPKRTLMFKLFKESGLVQTTENSTKYLITDRLLNIINRLTNWDVSSNLYNSSEIFYCYILLLNVNHGNRLAELINYLRNKISNNYETISEIEISCFIYDGDFNQSVIDTTNLNKRETIELFFNIDNRNISEETIKKFLTEFYNTENERKNSILNSFVRENFNWPESYEFQNAPKKIYKAFEMMNFLNQNNFYDIAMNYLNDPTNNVKKEIKKTLEIFYGIRFKNDKNINHNIIEFINNVRYDLIFKLILWKKYELVFRDYMNINISWFTNLGLLSNLKAENDSVKIFSINRRILNLFTYVIDNDLHNQTFNHFVDNITNHFANSEAEEINYRFPFTYDEVVWMMEKYKENCPNEIINRYQIWRGRTFPTIYEYLVNLAIAYSYDYSPVDFKNKYCNADLDENLLPWSWAGGGKSDGIIEDIDNGHIIFSTIESTMHRRLKTIIDSERNSIHQHAYDFCTLNNQDEKIALFVVDDKLSVDLLYQFCSYRKSDYYLDRNINIHIILLTTDIFLELFKTHRLNRVIRSFINKIPIDDNEFEKETNILEWYRQQMESIRR